MKQNELERSVARRTGESRRTIRRRGFSLLEEPPPAEEVRLALDCPGCGAAVPLPPSCKERLPEMAECGRCEAAYPYSERELTAREFPSAVATERPVAGVA